MTHEDQMVTQAFANLEQLCAQGVIDRVTLLWIYAQQRGRRQILQDENRERSDGSMLD